MHVRDKVDFKALNHPSMANILSGFVTLQSTGRCVITVSFNGNIRSVGVVSQQWLKLPPGLEHFRVDSERPGSTAPVSQPHCVL